MNFPDSLVISIYNWSDPEISTNIYPLFSESRKLFGGYRITPRYCKPTKESTTDLKGPNICMFNHECAQRNGEVVGACMDGFLFGTCCKLPDGVVGELAESDLNSSNYPDNIMLQEMNHTTTTQANPMIGHLTSSGVSQITNTLLGILPTAQDNAVVQVDVDDFSTPGVTHPTAPDTVIHNVFNDIDPDEFRPNLANKFATPKPVSTTSSYVKKPIYSKPPPIVTNTYTRPVFKPKPQKPDEEQYVLVPTISHETKPNKTQEIESIVNIIQMLNGSSSTSSAFQYSPTKKPVYIFSTVDSQLTKKPPSTSYVFSTTLPPRRTTTSRATTSASLKTKLTTKYPTKIYTKPTPLQVSSSSFRPSHSTFANSPDAFITTKKPPSTSYVYSTTLSKRPAISTEPTTTPTYSTASTNSVSNIFSALPSITPAVIVLAPATPTYSTDSPTFNSRPNMPQRRPVAQVTINNHITHNVYSSSERPAPTVLITPKPSTTAFPLNAVTDPESVYIEAETSPNEMNNFPPVRNPNLNMSIPVVTDDMPEFMEDDVLDTKVESFVNKIILGLQEPLQGLQEVVVNDNSSLLLNSVGSTTKKPIKKTGATTKKPAAKPTQNAKPTAKPNRVTTKNPNPSKKPAATSSKPTKKPATVTTTSTEQQTLGPINQDYRSGR